MTLLRTAQCYLSRLLDYLSAPSSDLSGIVITPEV